jgi:urea carboxylase-associated protein 1
VTDTSSSRTASVKEYESIAGAILEDTVIPARSSWSRRINRGERLRIVDLEGKQAVDFLCYNANDYADRYAAADTMKINRAGIFLSTGTVLYSVGLTPLFTIVHDTCGRHDTIGGCCSAALNTFRYGVGYQPNCRDNFLRELTKFGMGPRDLAANVNFFMHVPVGANGEMDMGPGISKPGDYVDLRAESDVLALISNCPQINNPVNDYNPTPIRVFVWTE